MMELIKKCCVIEYNFWLKSSNAIFKTIGVGWNKAHNHYHQYIVSRLALHHDTARWFCFDLGDNWDVKTVVHLHTNKTHKTFHISYSKTNCDHCSFFTNCSFFLATLKSGQRREWNTENICVHSNMNWLKQTWKRCDCQNNYIVPHSATYSF